MKFFVGVVFNVLFVFSHLEAQLCSSLNMEPVFLLNLLEILRNNGNVIFTKYGDGEYNCMRGEIGQNCDYDSYHYWMGEKLKESLVHLSQKENSFIGKWWGSDVYNYCDDIVQKNNLFIPWVWYHLVLNDDQFMHFNYMHQFVEFLVTTPRKKILICNRHNARLKSFFRADIFIEIPERNWSFDYVHWKEAVEKHLEKDCIILISAGMCSKILIDDMTQDLPVTCIDLGSSFDLLARKKTSRGFLHSYEEELAYYQEFLPDNWDLD